MLEMKPNLVSLIQNYAPPRPPQKPTRSSSQDTWKGDAEKLLRISCIVVRIIASYSECLPWRDKFLQVTGTESFHRRLQLILPSEKLPTFVVIVPSEHIRIRPRDSLSSFFLVYDTCKLRAEREWPLYTSVVMLFKLKCGPNHRSEL